MQGEKSDWIVLKFGGTSVSTAERWQVIVNHVKSQMKVTPRQLVVISALTQVTNNLQHAIAKAVAGDSNGYQKIYQYIVAQHINLAVDCGLISRNDDVPVIQACIAQRCSLTESHLLRLQPLLNYFLELERLLDGIQLTEEASPRLRARVLTYGEMMSTAIGILILHHNGLEDAIRLDAREMIISTDRPTVSAEDKYLQAQVKPRIDPQVAEEHSNVVLTQGFIASTSKGETCVLGRGGSDTSAALFAALLNAQELQIWTDVHGIFTSDPRRVPSARLIKEIDYRQAQELAAMGAKVLHPRCISPAQFASVPIQIRNTLDPQGQSTKIVSDPDIFKMTDSRIMAVVKRCATTLVTMTAYDMCGTSGFLTRLFSPFERLGISVDLVATSQFSVSVTLDHIPGGVEGEPFHQLLSLLEQEDIAVSVRKNCSVVSIVGSGLRKSLHSMGHLLEVLKGIEVYLVSESAEDLNLSFVVDSEGSDEIVQQMHTRLFPDDPTFKREGFGSAWTTLKQQMNPN